MKSIQVKSSYNDLKRFIKIKLVICEKIYDFFVEIGPSLAKKSRTKQTIRSIHERSFHTLYLSPVSTEGIEIILHHLKHSAPGYDENKPEILKLMEPSVKDPLLHIFNLSLSQGIFPPELKIANVLPLHKADDPMHLLLDILSEDFEKKMYSRLRSFLNLPKILFEFQFGFRKKIILPIWQYWYW